jgi:hypothetical protein
MKNSKKIKVQFIIDNADYLPDSEWVMATRLIKNPHYGRELLAAKTDEDIDALYYNIERTIDEEGED